MNSSRTIRILHVVPGLGPGGMELALSRVIAGLTTADMHHTIACLKGEPEIADRLPPQTDIRCLHTYPNEPTLPLRLAGLLREIRPHIIHARNWGAWPDIAAARLLVRPRVPFIYSFHGLGRADYMPWRRRLASAVLARITTCLFAVSDHSKQLMIDRWGWPSDRVAVIPNGTDTRRFHPSDTPHNNRRFIVGSVGNLRPVKNHALLVSACAELARRGVDLECRIAGEGEERENLIELAFSLKFADRLHLPGRVDDIPAFLRQLGAFVLSSDSEQHPNALVEAMATGLPAIGTRVGSVPEMFDNNIYGRLIDPGDAAALTAELDALIADSQLRRRLGEQARRRVCERYSLDAMLAAYDNLYRRLAVPAGGGP